MQKNITILTKVSPPIIKEHNGYRRLLSALSLLSYQLHLADNNLSHQASGVLTDSDTALANCTLPSLSLDDLLKPNLLENYLVRIIALGKLAHLKSENFNRGAMMAFHTRYKYLLLAYSQPAYRNIGPLVANIAAQPLSEFFQTYQKNLLKILSHSSSIKNHINVIQHIQGYFRANLSPNDKKKLSLAIELYRLRQLALEEVIQILNYWQCKYPDSYLSRQYYLTEYPTLLKICHGGAN